jgi:hypothetical protein
MLWRQEADIRRNEAHGRNAFVRRHFLSAV